MAASRAKKKTTIKDGGKSYAIVQTGGKQYRVSPGEILDVERIPTADGVDVELDHVLLVANGETVNVGTPVVEGAKVTADILDEGKGSKVTVFKYKPKVRYRRMKGHRQPYTRLAIKEIIC